MINSTITVFIYQILSTLTLISVGYLLLLLASKKNKFHFKILWESTYYEKIKINLYDKTSTKLMALLFLLINITLNLLPTILIQTIHTTWYYEDVITELIQKQAHPEETLMIHYDDLDNIKNYDNMLNKYIEFNNIYNIGIDSQNYTDIVSINIKSIDKLEERNVTIHYDENQCYLYLFSRGYININKTQISNTSCESIGYSSKSLSDLAKYNENSLTYHLITSNEDAIFQAEYKPLMTTIGDYNTESNDIIYKNSISLYLNIINSETLLVREISTYDALGNEMHDFKLQEKIQWNTLLNSSYCPKELNATERPLLFYKQWDGNYSISRLCTIYESYPKNVKYERISVQRYYLYDLKTKNVPINMSRSQGFKHYNYIINDYDKLVKTNFYNNDSLDKLVALMVSRSYDEYLIERIFANAKIFKQGTKIDTKWIVTIISITVISLIIIFISTYLIENKWKQPMWKLLLNKTSSDTNIYNKLNYAKFIYNYDNKNFDLTINNLYIQAIKINTNEYDSELKLVTKDD